MVRARRHPFVNATTLRNKVGNAADVNISTQTVRNRLRQSGLRSRKACIRIFLTRLHKQARLDRAQDHSNLNSLITIGILYSSPMSEGTVLTLQIDVLKYGEDVVSDFKMPIKISEHDRFGGTSALAGISRGGRTDLHIAMRGMMTGVRYRDETWTSRSDPTLVQSDPSSSSRTTTLDLIMPGWLRIFPA